MHTEGGADMVESCQHVGVGDELTNWSVFCTSLHLLLCVCVCVCVCVSVCLSVCLTSLSPLSLCSLPFCFALSLIVPLSVSLFLSLTPFSVCLCLSRVGPWGWWWQQIH